MEQTLHRNSGVALWRQIADEIRMALASGLANDAGRLPSEHALGRRFGVNRHTVRVALKALAQEGVVETRHGDGTYVRAHTKISYPLGLRTRFSDGVGQQARSTGSRLIAQPIAQTSAEAARALGLPADTRLLRLDICSEADGRALTRSVSWFELQRFSAMGEAFEKLGSITKALRRCGVEDYVRVSTRVEARHATADEIETLGLTDGAVVLITKAVNATPDGGPIQFSITTFPADRVSFELMAPDV